MQKIQKEIEDLTALYSQGKMREVLARGKELAARYPTSHVVHNILGAANSELGRFEQATECLSQALAVKPDHLAALHNLGNAFSRLGKHLDAIRSFSKALKVNPDFAESHFGLANELKASGQFDAAAESYANAIRLKPDHAEAYYNLGNVLRETGAPDDAIVNFQKALALKPDYATAHHSLGTVLLEIGKLEEASASFSKALATTPEAPRVNLLHSMSQLPSPHLKIDLAPLLKKASPAPGQSKTEFNSIREFTKAAIFHNAGHYEDAWKNLLGANRPQRIKFKNQFPRNMEINREFLDAIKIKTAFDTPFSPAESDRPISLLIVGPSHSGKSTLENLVSELPCLKRGLSVVI